MKKITTILFALIICAASHAATVTFTLTNSIGQPDTNRIKLQPIASYINADGSVQTIGLPFWIYPNTNGIVSTNLNYGSWIATNQFIVSQFGVPGSWGTSQGIIFQVPNNPAGSYQFGLLAQSGYNVFNYNGQAFVANFSNIVQALGFVPIGTNQVYALANTNQFSPGANVTFLTNAGTITIAASGGSGGNATNVNIGPGANVVVVTNGTASFTVSAPNQVFLTNGLLLAANTNAANLVNAATNGFGNIVTYSVSQFQSGSLILSNLAGIPSTNVLATTNSVYFDAVGVGATQAKNATNGFGSVVSHAASDFQPTNSNLTEWSLQPTNQFAPTNFASATANGILNSNDWQAFNNAVAGGITAATATNISQNTVVGGVNSGVVTNQTFSAAGTNAINGLAGTVYSNNPASYATLTQLAAGTNAALAGATNISASQIGVYSNTATGTLNMSSNYLQGQITDLVLSTNFYPNIVTNFSTGFRYNQSLINFFAGGAGNQFAATMVYSVGIGASALAAINTQGYNSAFGSGSLSNATGGEDIGLGYLSGVNITTGSSNIDIGNFGVATDTNIIRIGQGQSDTYLVGNVHGNFNGVQSGSVTLSNVIANAYVTNNQAAADAYSTNNVADQRGRAALLAQQATNGITAAAYLPTNQLVLQTGLATNLTIQGSLAVANNPFLTIGTNVVGMTNNGNYGANGSYLYNGSTLTNQQGDGYDIAFSSPNYLSRSNGVTLQTATTLNQAVWSVISGSATAGGTFVGSSWQMNGVVLSGVVSATNIPTYVSWGTTPTRTFSDRQASVHYFYTNGVPLYGVITPY